jgi:hypothetical protein
LLCKVEEANIADISFQNYYYDIQQIIKKEHHKIRNISDL